MRHTHQLSFGAQMVRKRYVSWAQDEHEREWLDLCHLHRLAPGLGPAPLARGAEDGAPTVTMTRVAGEPLGTGPLTRAQMLALCSALRRLFSLPVPAGLGERAWGPSVMRSHVRCWLLEQRDLSACREPELVERAVEAASSWLDLGAPSVDAITDPVLARGDGNLDNVLWDGSECRLIDFEEFGVSDLAYEVADVVEHASSRLGRYLDPERVIEELALSGGQRERLERFRTLLAWARAGWRYGH